MAARLPSQSSGGTTVIHGSAHIQDARRPAGYLADYRRVSTPRKSESGSVDDSGYGSREESDAAAPRPTPLCANPEQRTSQSPATGLSAGEPAKVVEFHGTELRLSRTKAVTVFNNKMEEVAVSRFYDIQVSVESLLLAYTRRKTLLGGSSRHKPMSARLLNVGRTVKEAKPHIVVFCVPEMRKKVQRFFDTDEIVKAFCRPSDPNLPSFEVVVCGQAPQLRSGEVNIEVIYDAGLARQPLANTFCGTPILLQADGKTRRATLGGLVKLEYADGHVELRCLTAGHPVREFLGKSDDPELGDDSLGSAFTDPDSDSGWSGSESMARLDEDEWSLHPVAEKTVPPDETVTDSWEFESPKSLARLVLANKGEDSDGRLSRGNHDYDWCLFSPNRLRPNAFRHDIRRGASHVLTFRSDITYRKQSPTDAEGLSDERVTLVSGFGVDRHGKLAAQPARILVGGPMREFVHAYIVNMDPGEALVDGDSGSWAFSEDTHEVIGHIVATDPLGAGYIVPLCDIFRDIEESIPGVTVTLPKLADITRLTKQSVGVTSDDGQAEEAEQSTELDPHSIHESEDKGKGRAPPLLAPFTSKLAPPLGRTQTFATVENRIHYRKPYVEDVDDEGDDMGTANLLRGVTYPIIAEAEAEAGLRMLSAGLTSNSADSRAKRRKYHTGFNEERKSRRLYTVNDRDYDHLPMQKRRVRDPTAPLPFSETKRKGKSRESRDSGYSSYGGSATSSSSSSWSRQSASATRIPPPVVSERPESTGRSAVPLSAVDWSHSEVESAFRTPHLMEGWAGGSYRPLRRRFPKADEEIASSLPSGLDRGSFDRETGQTMAATVEAEKEAREAMLERMRSRPRPRGPSASYGGSAYR